MEKERIVVAMSGGVDSSVAAALLKSKGYEVIGMTMCFNLTDTQGRRPICCSLQGIEDARRVAHKLDIKHYVLNMQKELNSLVIKEFCEEYLKGRTPNPCVLCNRYLKFGALLKKALSLGAAYLATGHYARIEKSQVTPRLRSGQASHPSASLGAGKSKGEKRYLLKKGVDKNKDQSYFLYRLNQPQLRHTLFPLGGYTKQEARVLAKDFGLSVAEKAASQEICFISDNNYHSFIKMRLKDKLKPGLITDKQGNLLGQHNGIALYTIGQRQGLGVAAGYPIYIIEIDRQHNRLIAGPRQEVYKRRFTVREPHFILAPRKNKFVAKVRIRYNHKEAAAEINLSGRKASVCFKQPQFAITPGQSAVFYSGDNVLGGGLINEVLE